LQNSKQSKWWGCIYRSRSQRSSMAVATWPLEILSGAPHAESGLLKRLSICWNAKCDYWVRCPDLGVCTFF
jgi:hypothetical protein